MKNRKLNKFIDTLPLRYTLLIFSALFTLIITLFLITSYIQTSNKFILNTYKDHIDSLAEQADTYFKIIHTNNDNIIKYLNQNAEIPSLLTDYFDSSNADEINSRITLIKTIFDDHIKQFDYIGNITIQGINNFTYTYSPVSLTGEFIENDSTGTDIISEALSYQTNEGTPFFFPQAKTSNGKIISTKSDLTDRFIVSRSLKFNNETIGIVLLSISNLLFTDYFNLQKKYQRNISLIDKEEKTIIWKTENSTFNDDHAIYLEKQLNSFPATLVIKQDSKYLFGNNKRTLTKIIVITIICISISLIISTLFSKKITKPIHGFTKMIKNSNILSGFKSSQLSQQFNIHPFFQRITFYFLLSVIFPMSILGISTIKFQYDEYKDLLLEYSEESIDFAGFYFDYYTRKIRYNALLIAYSDTIQDFLSEQKTLSLPKEKDMNTFLSRYSFLFDYVNLYDLQGKFLHSTVFYEQSSLDEITSDLLPPDNTENKGLEYTGIKINYNLGNHLVFRDKIYSINPLGLSRGYITILIEFDSLFSFIDNFNTGKYTTLFIMDPQNIPITSKIFNVPDILETQHNSELIRKLNETYHRKNKFSLKDYHASVSSELKYGFRILGLIPRQVIENDLKIMITINGMFLLAILLLIAIFTLYFSYKITIPIIMLLEHVRAQSDHHSYNEQTKLSYNSNEIHNLSVEFERIQIQMSKLNKEKQDSILREKELLFLEKEATLNALQQQINPHFLFNTLDAIKWEAFKYGEMTVVEMITALGVFFRSTIARKNEKVSVFEEFNLIQNYIYIQKIRYGDKFDFKYEIDEDTNSTRIPQFILQPLIENSINHGHEFTEIEGKIKLTISKSDNNLLIKIYDNGKGIPDEKLTFIQSNIKSDERTDNCIGLNNVYKRIKLLYGGKASFTIFSEVGKFTEFVILLPLET